MPNAVDLNEPATWFSSPDAQGLPFGQLVDAVRHAVSIPLAERHQDANIVTQSGSVYGWDAIEAMAEHIL